MASIQIAGMGRTVQKFNLREVRNTAPPREPDLPLLDLDDLRPCMAFRNLRRMNLDLRRDVDLSDDALLALASAWPRIEELLINANWGWSRPGGITPDGLALLLQTCPSLTSIALAIDTREYTQIPARRFREPPNASSFARQFHINVLDSIIEEESVDAMAVFLPSIVPHSDFILTAWETWSVMEHPDLDLYSTRWESVHSQANEAIKKQGLDIHQELSLQA